MDPKEIILWTEDDENDVFIIERAVQKMQAPVSLHVVPDGVVAIQYLMGEGKFADRALHPLPTLILVDIKMPRKSGFEFLEWLKSDGRFTHVPVVMISASPMKSDIAYAHELGVAAYLVKPIGEKNLERLFKATEEFLAAQPVQTKRPLLRWDIP
ncbi:MAG: response regulator with CheY-like receiver domain and winged-helix DNA-binding domain [Verrucomicrobiales bacterium]|nr:response regulator with CheY-like receiver domain and winged-helix DNA-binding domain [Verrucomicrobiales bacterium]